MQVVRSRWVQLTTLALVLALPVSLHAQLTSGSIAGRVVDETGGVLPGATVTLLDERSGDTRSSVTSETGEFLFPALQPATYTLTIELDSFAPYQLNSLVLPAGETLSLGGIELKAGGLTETVNVTAEGSFVQTRSSERSALLDSTQMQMLSARGRDPMEIVQTLPGVQYRGPSESAGSGLGTSAPSIGGNRNTWNTMAVDGLVGNDLGSPQDFSSTVSFDAISEIRVQLNNYQAEHGRNAGALVSIVTKSGTRDFTGSAYWYKRNEALNANSFFNNKNDVEKPLYRYDTAGFTLGGPVAVPGWFNQDRRKLFFFYSFENADIENPQGLRQVTTPTERERQGDFSQTHNLDGQLMVIRDPLTGEPFPGNRIPADRLESNGQALLGVLPMPNRLDRGLTEGKYNYVFQESVEVPKRQHLARVDYRPNEKDAMYVRYLDWFADNKGFAVPAGASNWGLVGAHYTFRDRGAVGNYTRILSSSLVNEVTFGGRYSTEDGPVLSADGLERVTRQFTGFDLGQFNPELNPLDIVPRASFGGIESPANISYDGRFPLTGADTFLNLANTLTWTRGAHTIKTGVYAEWVRNQEGHTGEFAGSFDFGRNTNNPLDTGHPYANALLGVFNSYAESTTRPPGDGTANMIEWFAQDTWRLPRVTLDYGVRFAYYTHYVARAGLGAAFALERYDPDAAPPLFEPALLDGRRVGRNPVTGEFVPVGLIGGLVPGSGDPVNGMVTSDDPSYPDSFMDQPSVLAEPRVGFSWDVNGDGQTAVRGGFGIFHNMRNTGNRVWAASRNPPIQFTPSIPNSTFDDLLEFQSGGVLFPSGVQGFERDIRTPVLYSFTLGVQRDIGWNTVVDAAYVGSRGERLPQSRSINNVPYGARFLSANQDVTTGTPLSDNFYRPFPGYAGITFYENSGESNYDALQVQVNRRFTQGFQFGVAYTLSRSRDMGSGDGAGLPLYQDARDWSYSLSGYDQTHVAVINYTWDLPRASRLWNNVLVAALLDNWQLSGITAFASGTPTGVGFSTTDEADIAGGGDGTRIGVTGDPRLSSGERSLESWFDTSVFRRPEKGEVPPRSEHGNQRRDIIRNPGWHNWDLTLFKNIPFGDRRALQLRWEVYNLFNHTQFSSIDTGADFDEEGNQVNERFGEVTGTRQPRVMQASLRFSW